MKIRLLVIIFFPVLCYSQNRNANWCFGDSAGIIFNNVINPIPFSSGMDCRGSCSSISDTSGNLLFYALNRYEDDSSAFIFNNLHQLMQNGSRLCGAGAYNDIIIINEPGNLSKYYLFHSGRFSTQGLYYSIVDMSLNNGLGGVIEKNKAINYDRIGDCLTAVKHGNGRDWWLISKLSDGTLSSHLNRFFVYLVTPDSIYQPIVQDFNDATDIDFQKIIFHPSGNKFVLINTAGYMSEFDFDRCSGLISLNQNIFPELSGNSTRLFWEGAYSPNEEMFYICTSYSFTKTTAYLLQFNLLSPNIATTIDTLEAFTPPIGTGAPRLAPDNKIYLSRAYLISFPGFPYPDSVYNYINMNLSVINSPDSLGSACNYQPFSFYLGGKRTYYGLPNNPNYDLDPLAGSICDSLTIGVATHSKNKKVSVQPNPFKDKISFDVAELGKFKFVITDVLGKKVYEAMQQEKTEIDLSFLHQGLYIATLSNGKSVYQTKIIKQ